MNPRRFRDFWFTHEGRQAALKIIGVGAGSVFIVIAGLFLYFAKDLPSPGKVNSLSLKQTTRFYDRTGQTLLYEVYGDENRSVVELEKISKHMQNATIAIEDKDFYKHGAFSSLGILRAAINNLFNRESGIQGGSTITQQYVKNALLTPERTLTRKVKELILSIQIEQLYNKEDILELYLNEIPYGTQAYGVQAASKTYFNKTATELTLDEAALLAALPRATTYYSPYGQHLDELINRRNLIIDQMREQGYATGEEAEAAKALDTIAKVNTSPNLYADIKAPHFVLQAQEYLEQKYGSQQVTEGGLQVITTLDLGLQQAAEEAVKNGIGIIDKAGGNNAALVAGNPNTGEVLAMVGSRDFRHPGFGTFNAALARRQPGSSFKPYVYATGFKTNNWGPGSVMYDVATDFGGYRPNNYDNRFRGQMTIRTALAASFNIPAVKMLYIVGLDQALNTAHELGITTLEDPSQFGLSLVLGAGEVKLADHVNAYQSFANGGLHYPQTPVLKATDPKGNVLEELKDPQGKRVLDPQVSYLITSILSDDVARAPTFGRNNRDMTIPGKTTFVKTGTTDSNRDGWMIGGSQSIIAGVWVGHSDNKPMSGITSRLTGSIWAPFMKKALEGKPNEPFAEPPGIKKVTLDSLSGTAPGQGTTQQHSDVFAAWFQPRPSPGPQKAVIDKVSGKLATDCTPALARQEVTGRGIAPEIPPTDPAYPRWNPPVQALASRLGLGQGGAIPTEKDTVHQCSDVKPAITVSTATDEDKIKITAQVTQGTHPVNIIDYKVNGQLITSQPIGGSGSYATEYKPPGAGPYTVAAEVRDTALYGGEASVTTTFTPNGSGASNFDWQGWVARRRFGYQSR